MSAGIRGYVDLHKSLVEGALRAALPVTRLKGTGSFNEAVYASIFSGGKRMRPVLTLLACEICGGTVDQALAPACAVEFLHASSLVMDDLPAMDDARVRRGRPALHTAFGQDIALLAALALLNESYALFASVPGLLPRAVLEIGANGMIGGQASDVCGGPSCSGLEKTTALTRLAMSAGAIAARADAADIDALVRFGQAMGETYQLCDDLTDALASDADLGKNSRQDRRNGRNGYVLEHGPGPAWRHANSVCHQACSQLLSHFGDRAYTHLLVEFHRSVLERTLAVLKNDPSLSALGLPRPGHLECLSVAGGGVP